MSKPYYVGYYREDGLNGPNRGWIVGKFMDELPRKNNSVEIKYWEYKVGETDHPMKESSIIECTIILKGKIKAVINGDELVLKAGEYVVVEPGIPNNTATYVLEDTIGLTIKAPSDPSAKKIVNSSDLDNDAAPTREL